MKAESLIKPFNVKNNTRKIPLLSIAKPLKVASLTKQGEIMGIRHKELPIEGVQFHPESFLTQDGEKLLLNFLRQ